MSSKTATPCFYPHKHRNMMFLTDSGMETTFIFKDQIELREFASFEMLMTEKGRNHIEKYYARHAALAHEINTNMKDDGTTTKVGFVLEGVTWRANPDWMTKLGYENNEKTFQEIANHSIQVMKNVQAKFPNVPMVVHGNIGPRSDGYVPQQQMTAAQAKEYHQPLVHALKRAGADAVSAMTLNYINEGIGIAWAAHDAGIPVVLSFTVETNGCLITGEPLSMVIETIDKATHNRGRPAYYMINCAHPTHFAPSLQLDDDDEPSWKERIGGVRANASKLSHAELDDATELDDGNPQEFGQDYSKLLELLPNANVFGGCCGTDDRHVRHVRNACASAFFDNNKASQQGQNTAITASQAA